MQWPIFARQRAWRHVRFVPRKFSCSPSKHVDTILFGCITCTQDSHLWIAGSTQAIDTHGVLTVVNLFTQACLHAHTLLLIQKTLEDTVLHPGSITGEGTMHARATPIIRNVITDN